MTKNKQWSFFYFDLKINPKGELRKVSANKSKKPVDNTPDGIREVEPNIYLIFWEKSFYRRSNEDIFPDNFILDASESEQAASICQIKFPFDFDPNNIQTEK